jgi:hypothetical protein
MRRSTNLSSPFWIALLRIFATTDGNEFIADQVAMVSLATPGTASNLFATTSSSPLRSRSLSSAMSSSLSASMLGANKAERIGMPYEAILSSEIMAMQVSPSMSINRTKSDVFSQYSHHLWHPSPLWTIRPLFLELLSPSNRRTHGHHHRISVRVRPSSGPAYADSG